MCVGWDPWGFVRRRGLSGLLKVEGSGKDDWIEEGTCFYGMDVDTLPCYRFLAWLENVESCAGGEQPASEWIGFSE